MTGASSPSPDASLMRELRLKMLSTTPEELGMAADDEYPRVRGVVADLPIGEHTATVLAWRDGSASLYTTSTFGVLGGEGHARVRAAARACVKGADGYHDEAVPAPGADFPYPAPGRVRFHLVGYDGVRVIDAPHDEIVAGGHRTTPLFAAVQKVLTELRRIAEPGAGASELVPDYLNALMTAMARTGRRSVEIAASGPVPPLEPLVAGDAELRDWVAEQALPHAAMDAKAVIRALRHFAKVAGLPFLPRKGELRTALAFGGGPHAARVFDIRVSPFDRAARIEMAPDGDPRVAALQAELDADAGGA